MRRMNLVGAVILTMLTMNTLQGCMTIPPVFIGDPSKHGFVIVEGEAAITVQNDPREPGARPTEISRKFYEIREVTLQSIERPTYTVRGRNQAGLTWFSDLEPGNYRVKDIHLNEDIIYQFPRDAAPELVLSFNVGAGELLYLGYIEVTQFKRNFNLTNVLHFNVVHTRDEVRAWEHVYDIYAHTPWEGLLLKKIETTQKRGDNKN